jgi:outer membrane protein
MHDQLEIDKANLPTAEYMKKQEAAYADFMKLKTDLSRQANEKIERAIEKVTKEKNLIILYKNSVAFGGIDVTQDVINNIE